MKRYITLAGAAVLILSMSLGFSSVAKADNLYSEKTEDIVTKGVTYSNERRLTTEGFQNIHALEIDLTADNVKIAPVESSTEYGLKETALKLLNDSGAVAGVNADFFGLTGKYSAGFGPVVADGEVISVGTDKNLTSQEFAAYFMDDNGNSFIDYLKFSADFVNERGAKLELASINKITQMVYPIYFNANAAPSTKDLDARFSDLVKITVVNNRIKSISQPGEVVDCPAVSDGYLIIVKGIYTDYVNQNFMVDDVVQTVINSSIDLDSIQTAVGGGGRILSDGAVVSDGTIISGRQPRTALGISQNSDKLVLVVVDGRGDSIGATHSEMAEIMKEYGAYNAMHLDGGGSSTLVAETVDEDTPSIKNDVSEGTPRKIMTALGVFNTSETGSITELKVEAASNRAIVGEGISLSVKGYDYYYNKINIPESEITYDVVESGAYISGGKVYSTEPGIVTVTASYAGYTAFTNVTFANASTLIPSVSIVNLSPGQSVSFSFKANDTEGYTSNVTGGVKYTVSNPAIGSMYGGTFTAGSTGSGYIECVREGARCYIAVNVGGTLKTVESFENSPAVKFSAYPATLKGSTSYASTASNGAKSLQIKYSFGEASSTQAAYATFANPITFNGSPDKITMSVMGNGTEEWVRGKITDSKGVSYTIDFSKTLNWSGWKDVTASIPSGVSYPIKLETIYVAALSNTKTSEQTVLFDNIRAVVADGTVSAPDNTQFTDVQNVDIISKVDGSFYVTFAGAMNYTGATKAPNYDSARTTVSSQLANNSDLIVYAGGSDTTGESLKTIRYTNNYGFYNYGENNLSIVQLTAKNGTLRNTNAAQWKTFAKDVSAAGNTNVIFIMDCTPSNFSDKLETELMRSALKTIKDSGKNVYVISSGGSSSWNSVKDGIRYINLPNLWNADGSLNSAFKTMTIKIDQTGMVYDINSVF